MIKQKLFDAEFKSIGERRVETVISTDTYDRENDRMMVENMDLDAYRANPIVLWSHDPKTPPIARSPRVWFENGVLRSIDEFPPRGIYPLADQIHDLVVAGFINAKSVGVAVHDWTPNARGGADLTRTSLLEHSYVSIPANADALVTARSKGLDQSRLNAWLGYGGDTVTKGKISCPGIGGDPCVNSDNGMDCVAGRRCPIVGHALASFSPRRGTVLELDDEIVSDAEAKAIVREIVAEATREAIMQLTGRVD